MSDFDITGKIGPSYEYKADPETGWPMYSFERPAYVLWNSIGQTLHERGWTDEEIKTWLQSKQPRWALDGELSTAIQAIGKLFAESCTRVSE